ncbi:phosphatase PAP2 family protein [Micromonospora phytophila]|uniref:phosphatase PAP2 family protein n=1 Tax=Micromonospora phytophila TaxID=709888 RepID=UPI00202EAC23|nr:phosphatase PAP2 family protein [Micromonospora phytophila]MCM0678010.1 phosphatase PAP2 family protein [Micromonospora phytophila]
MVETGRTDVPEFSVDWYQDIVGFAADTPQPVRWFAGHFTEGAILLLGALLLVAAVSRLGGTARDRAYALVAPVTVVLAYGCSEWLKTVVDQDRPCRAATAELAIIAGGCPPTGDWSFPSNHATIAGALAAATLLLSRRLGLVALPVAALAAFSRTFVGVHYPHDVVAGALLGALVAVLLTPLLARPVADLLRRRSRHPDRPAPDATPTRP